MEKFHATDTGIVEFTAEENSQRDQEIAEWESGVTSRAETAVRKQRDALLAETDWVVTKALEANNSVPSAWATYRQALRDITGHANFPYLQDADWPTKP